MSAPTIELNDVKLLRRKYSVACGIIAEQGVVIKAQTDTLRRQSDEIVCLRKMLAKMVANAQASGAGCKPVPLQAPVGREEE